MKYKRIVTRINRFNNAIEKRDGLTLTVWHWRF